LGEPDNALPILPLKSSWDGVKTIQARTFNYKIYEIEPVPAPRMTRGDRSLYRPCVKRYMTYRNKLKSINPMVNWHPLSVQFVLPMPDSWSEKKKKEMFLKPHQNRPDLDNLLKAFKDALLEEDSAVWSYDMVTKVWGRTGSIIVLSLI